MVEYMMQINTYAETETLQLSVEIDGCLVWKILVLCQHICKTIMLLI